MGGQIRGKVALVTGATGGLGSHVATVLYNAGARLILTGRRECGLAELSGKLGNAEYRAVDANSPEGPDVVVDAIRGSGGRLDILVNALGVCDDEAALLADDHEFRRVIETNLVTPYRVAVRAAKLMSAGRGGSIVNVSSVLAQHSADAFPYAAYAASKAGLEGLTRELANQWAALGIRVNAVAPGWFSAGMADRFSAGSEGAGWIRRHVPFQRAGELAELDAAVLFLSGDSSGYVTGQVLSVDGGFSVR